MTLETHFIFPHSTVKTSVIKEHVSKFLENQRIAYGDVSLTEFNDPFLTEHVQNISICDTELDCLGKQVG